jgi:hypothetical protein
LKADKERLENIKSQSYLDNPCESSVQLEKAFSGILSFNETSRVDLIIMGSHGLKHGAFIGSNTEEVVRPSGSRFNYQKIPENSDRKIVLHQFFKIKTL